METTPKNKQFDISYYSDVVGIHGRPSFFGKSILCGKVDTVKGVSVQSDWALSGVNERFMEFIRFIAEKGNWNEKVEGR